MKDIGKKAGFKNKDEFKSALLERYAMLDFKLLAKDLEQFLFSPGDAKKLQLFPEYVKKL